MVQEIGVLAVLIRGAEDDPDSVEFSVQPFARLDDGQKVMA